MTNEELEKCADYIDGACMRDLLEEYAIRKFPDAKSAQLCIQAYAVVMKSLSYIPQEVAEASFRYRRLLKNKPSYSETRQAVMNAIDKEIDTVPIVAKAMGMPPELVNGLCNQYRSRFEMLKDRFSDIDALLLRLKIDPEGGYQKHIYMNDDGEYDMVPVGSIIAFHENDDD